MPVPPLPRELHHEIIEWCCSRVQYKRPGYEFLYPFSEEEYRQIRALCLVNKAWLAYTQPILYASISLHERPRSLDQLQLDRTLPPLVKALFLPASHEHTSSFTHLGIDFPLLLALVDLQLFDETSWLGFTRIVSHAPALKELSLGLTIFSGAVSSPPVSLSSLKMLNVSTLGWEQESSNVLDYLLSLDADHFPHGLEVFYCDFWYAELDDAIVFRFLDRVGPSLLHLNVGGMVVDGADNFLCRCPLLQSFGAAYALDAEALASDSILSTGHPTLSTLRLPGPVSRDSHYDPAGLVRCVAEAKLLSSSSSNHPSSPAFPSFATIHIVDAPSRYWLHFPSTAHRSVEQWADDGHDARWRSLVDACEELGLALEDFEGETCSDWTAALSELDAEASRND